MELGAELVDVLQQEEYAGELVDGEDVAVGHFHYGSDSLADPIVLEKCSAIEKIVVEPHQLVVCLQVFLHLVEVERVEVRVLVAQVAGSERGQDRDVRLQAAFGAWGDPCLLPIGNSEVVVDALHGVFVKVRLALHVLREIGVGVDGEIDDVAAHVRQVEVAVLLIVSEVGSVYALVPVVGAVLLVDIAPAVEALQRVTVGVRVGPRLDELHVVPHDGEVIQEQVPVLLREQEFAAGLGSEPCKGRYDLVDCFVATVRDL